MQVICRTPQKQGKCGVRHNYTVGQKIKMALAPTDSFRLEKCVWSESDFEHMGWHDVVVHALGFDTGRHELMLDIDYIFAWVDPLPPSPYYSFWLAPATLVFHDVWDLKMQYDASLGFQLQGITRTETRIRPHPLPEGKKEESRWTLEGNEGEISFWATGYTQFTRRLPTHSLSGQSFSLADRLGISFDRPQKTE
jgi:hypothetical protein